MKFSNLPKEKRDRLLLVCMATVGVLVLIIFVLIIPQYHYIAAIGKKIADTRGKLQDMKDVIRKADVTASDLHDVTYTLSNAESDMAVDDPNAWIYNTIRNFKSKYKVDFTVIGQLSMGNVELLPKFPFKQLRVNVSGTAYYHDLGKFIADIEDNYPHTRIENLTLEPAGAADNSEKLEFRMDIIALVKPST
jgi:hypothetical protein